MAKVNLCMCNKCSNSFLETEITLLVKSLSLLEKQMSRLFLTNCKVFYKSVLLREGELG